MFGRGLAIGSVSLCSTTDRFNADDIMKARCKTGYTVDALKSLQALLDEYEHLSSSTEDHPSMRHKDAVHTLSRVWSWVERVEALHSVDPTIDFENCGALKLLQGSKQNTTGFTE